VITYETGVGGGGDSESLIGVIISCKNICDETGSEFQIGIGKCLRKKKNRKIQKIKIREK
jgi:hypothetical protein